MDKNMAMAQLIVNAVSAISVLVIIISLVLNFTKDKKIDAFSSLVMSDADKKKIHKKIKQNKYLLIGAFVLNIINFILVSGIIKFVVPIITLILATNILITLFDDTDVNEDIKEEDVDRLTEYKSRRTQDIKEKARIREAENKKRRES